MGCDFYVNIGPVVVINNPPVELLEKHKSCCNNNCKQWHKTAFSKFCADCGSPIQEWSNPILAPRKIDYYTLLNETLVPADHAQSGESSTVVLVSNKRIEGCQHFNLKYEEFMVFPNVEEIGTLIKKFSETFQAELTKLKEIFGEQNVSVRYGTVGTISC